MHSVSCLIPASNSQNWAWVGKRGEEEEETVPLYTTMHNASLKVHVYLGKNYPHFITRRADGWRKCRPISLWVRKNNRSVSGRRPCNATRNIACTCSTTEQIHTVKPVKYGHPWDEPEVSLIQRCPHFKGQFALRTAVWDQMRCPYFTGCPHFAGLLFTGFTVDT
jgi:hypothetical protein